MTGMGHMFKAKYLFSIFCLIMLSLIALGNGCASTKPVTDYSTVLNHLNVSDVSFREDGEITQDFFNVKSRIIVINESNIEVFEYDTPEAMKVESKYVSPIDGSTFIRPDKIVSVNWIDSPHFYKAGRIIVLYVGRNQTIISLLENILGKEFAPRPL
jgi:hypothetical protein